MNIQKINKLIKCDIVLCNENANYQIDTNSYKGTMFVCEKCFNLMQKLFKRTTIKNEQNNK